MPPKPRFSRTQVEHAQNLVAEVERRRAAGRNAEELTRLLADMHSEDEPTRAKAVREICPCRMDWDAFDDLRRAAKRLQHDPDPEVRANARHVEQDAREVAACESLVERLRESEEREEELRDERARRAPQRTSRRQLYRL